MKNTTQRLRHGKTLAATGLATVLAASVCTQAWADGIADAKPSGPGVRSLSALRTPTDVTVDYTVLNGLSRTPMLLIPGSSASGNSDPIILRPPAGVAPVLIPPPGVRASTSVIKLRPPPGVRVADLKPATPAPAAASTSAPVQMAKVDPKPEPAKPAAKPEAAKVAPAPAAKPPVQTATPTKPAAPAAPPAQAAAPTPAKPAPAPAVPPPAKVAVAPPAPAPAAKPAAATPSPAPKPAPQTPPAQAKVEAPKVEPAKPAAVTPPPAPKPAAAPAATPPAAVAQAPASTPEPGAPRSLLTPPPAETKQAETKPAQAKPAEATPAETKVAVVPQPASPSAEPAQPAAAPASSETKTAALTPVKKPDVPETLSISFDVGVPDVPASASNGLKTLAALIKADPALRIQLLAFASDPEKSVSRSRRLALERAVNVRKQLLDAGIDSTRIEVRALGEQSGDGAPDRVDAITSRR